MRNQILWLISLLMPQIALATQSEFLNTFSKNPQLASQIIPTKSRIQKTQLFSQKEIDRRDFVRIKDKYRTELFCKGIAPGNDCHERPTFEPLQLSTDFSQINSFLGFQIEKNIFNLSNLETGSVAIVPWAGHYWPMAEGGIGVRYNDPAFPYAGDFKIHYDFYTQNYLKPVVPNRKELAKLSPAEKYDYLIGDGEWTLTKNVWHESKSVYDSIGSVESWMGICHGWSPASFMMAEPKKTFDIDLQGGRGVLRVYPNDIKALASQLWAQADFETNFLGGRCNDKNPKMDPRGRIISKDCFDMNPASWHLTLLHWVGLQRWSFVFDATYDYEVWNQPISSYKIKYFNPLNSQYGTLNDSLIPYSNIPGDYFKNYRSQRVKYLVGVESEISYVEEDEEPNAKDSSLDPYEHVVKVSYYYDLELDENYNIIGGEWYQQAHPDMLWKPAPRSWARVAGEENLPAWNGLLPVNGDFFRLGLMGSWQGLPLSKIVLKLNEWAQ